MIPLIARLLQDAASVSDNHGIGGDHDGGVGDRGQRVIEAGGVYIEAFLHRGLEDIFERPELFFGQVLGFCGGDDFEVREPELCGVS